MQNNKKATDPAQKLYKEKNKSLDLEREVDTYAMWGFSLSLGIFFFIGVIPILFFVMWIIPFIAFTLCGISIYRIRKENKLKGLGFAITGLILSGIQICAIIGIAIYMIFSAFYTYF